jgi:hypothetical protein
MHMSSSHGYATAKHASWVRLCGRHSKRELSQVRRQQEIEVGWQRLAWTDADWGSASKVMLWDFDMKTLAFDLLADGVRSVEVICGIGQ